MTFIAVKHCEWADKIRQLVIILISGGELRAATSAPALGEGNV